MIPQKNISVITSSYKYFRAARLESFKTLGEMHTIYEQTPFL